MRKEELIRKLREITGLGFVKSHRKGSTGIGKTFEDLLGVKENNLAIPDIGILEIKTVRKNANSLITLFTFNRGVWKINQRELIDRYGYIDNRGRKALKKTLIYGAGGNMTMDLDESNTALIIRSGDSGEVLGVFDLYYIVGKFLTKLSKVLYVKADVKRMGDEEFFHYNEFYILYGASPKSFIGAIKKGYVAVDLRMHITERNSVRNRGTAFRVKEDKLHELYEKKEKLNV